MYSRNGSRPLQRAGRDAAPAARSRGSSRRAARTVGRTPRVERAAVSTAWSWKLPSERLPRKTLPVTKHSSPTNCASSPETNASYAPIIHGVAGRKRSSHSAAATGSAHAHVFFDVCMLPEPNA